jgi:CheY-like chemotaxis protein
MLLGDPSKIRQVLINLLNNAIKFTHKGSVGLRCSTTDASSEEITVLFEVSDTGIGIAPEHFETIFNPFQQGDNSISRNYFGSGLGLTISKNLVESMGGTITVKSRLGEGSTFSFSLTFKKSTHLPAQMQHKKLILPRISLNHIHILFVDDDPSNRLLGNVILANNKIKADFAASGEEAIKLFRPGRYHLIFLDINMPGTSGLDVLLHIRESERNTNEIRPSVIIAMTANVLRKHIEQYLKAGMDDVILKPFKEEEFYEKILIHSNNLDDLASNAHTTIPQSQVTTEYDLTELLQITKGNKEFTMLMLDTFIENGKTLLLQMNTAIENNDYRSIAEAAHRLTPSFEQLGFRETTLLLKELDNRFLKNGSGQDPAVVKETIRKIEEGIEMISKVRDEMG